MNNTATNAGALAQGAALVSRCGRVSQSNQVGASNHMKTLDSLTAEQLSALDEIVYRSGLIESVKNARRGFRVQGKFFFYFCDANHAARLIALRLASSATA